jgi:hypothetical protein
MDEIILENQSQIYLASTTPLTAPRKLKTSLKILPNPNELQDLSHIRLTQLKQIGEEIGIPSSLLPNREALINFIEEWMKDTHFNDYLTKENVRAHQKEIAERRLSNYLNSLEHSQLLDIQSLITYPRKIGAKEREPLMKAIEKWMSAYGFLENFLRTKKIDLKELKNWNEFLITSGGEYESLTEREKSKRLKQDVDDIISFHRDPIEELIQERREAPKLTVPSPEVKESIKKELYNPYYEQKKQIQRELDELRTNPETKFLYLDFKPKTYEEFQQQIRQADNTILPYMIKKLNQVNAIDIKGITEGQRELLFEGLKDWLEKIGKTPVLDRYLIKYRVGGKWYSRKLSDVYLQLFDNFSKQNFIYTIQKDFTKDESSPKDPEIIVKCFDAIVLYKIKRGPEDRTISKYQQDLETQREIQEELEWYKEELDQMNQPEEGLPIKQPENFKDYDNKLRRLIHSSNNTDKLPDSEMDTYLTVSEKKEYKSRTNGFFEFCLDEKFKEHKQLIAELKKLQIFTQIIQWVPLTNKQGKTSFKRKPIKELNDCCFVYALQQSGKFTEGELNKIRMRIENRYLPLTKLEEIAKEFDIHLTIRDIDDQAKTNKTHKPEYNKQGKIDITLNGYRNHYFLDIPHTSLTYYYINSIPIRSPDEFDKVVEGGRTRRGYKEKHFISSHHLVRKLL